MDDKVNKVLKEMKEAFLDDLSEYDDSDLMLNPVESCDWCHRAL